MSDRAKLRVLQLEIDGSQEDVRNALGVFHETVNKLFDALAPPKPTNDSPESPAPSPDSPTPDP